MATYRMRHTGRKMQSEDGCFSVSEGAGIVAEVLFFNFSLPYRVSKANY